MPELETLINRIQGYSHFLTDLKSVDIQHPGYIFRGAYLVRLLTTRKSVGTGTDISIDVSLSCLLYIEDFEGNSACVRKSGSLISIELIQ